MLLVRYRLSGQHQVDEISNNDVTIITVAGRRIHLVGTAHVSAESVELVRRTIEEVRPEAVAVELCAARLQALRDPERWKQMDLWSVIRQGRSTVLFAQLLLVGYQKRLGRKLGVTPGAEMIEAVNSAERIGAAVVLADRDIKTTLQRLKGSLSFWGYINLLGGFLTALFDPEQREVTKEEIESLKQRDSLEAALTEFSSKYPQITSVLISERDRYLAEKIRCAPGGSVVAVVGAGHIPGIVRHIETPSDLGELDTLPRPSPAAKAASWGIPLLVIALIGYGFFAGGAQHGLELASVWVWVTGTSAAIGALLAGAHPLTIAGAFLSAPITTLHPLIGSGMVAGLIEIALRRPRVSDLESVSEDLGSLRGFWRNRVTRVLLVVILTSLCGTLGVLLGVGELFSKS